MPQLSLLTEPARRVFTPMGDLYPFTVRIGRFFSPILPTPALTLPKPVYVHSVARTASFQGLELIYEAIVETKKAATLYDGLRFTTTP